MNALNDFQLFVLPVYTCFLLYMMIETHSELVSCYRLHKDNKRIVYTILEYCPLLDSCNMTTDDWGRIGKDIEVLILNFDMHHK